MRACAPWRTGTSRDSAAARRTVRTSREQKSRCPALASRLFCLPGGHATETAMSFISRFWRYSLDTYGGAPLLLTGTLIQLALLAWLIVGCVRARRGRKPPGL